MKIEAFKSFCGALSMAKGEVREYGNETVLADLISAGYVKEVNEESEVRKTTPKRSAKKNESQRD